MRTTKNLRGGVYGRLCRLSGMENPVGGMPETVVQGEFIALRPPA